MADGQDNRAPTIVATVVALWVLSYLAVAARFLGRWLGHTKLWWDDWLILLAAVIYIPGGTFDLVEVHFGAGKHVQDIVQKHPDHLTSFLKGIYAGEICYPPTIVCIKCSILALYNRLFGVRRGFARVCYVLMGITVAWGVATLLPAIFQCNPVRRAWYPASTEGHCISLRPYLVGTNVPNVLLDFAVLVTPLHPIWSLKLPTAKKVWISGIFVLGACETAFSIIRLVALTSLDVSDPTWNYFSPIVWSSIEICVGSICACLPVMAPLIPKIFQGRTKPEETYKSSRFDLSTIPGGTADYAKQKFNRLADSTDSEVGGEYPKGITQTTDIDIVEERNLAFQSKA